VIHRGFVAVTKCDLPDRRKFLQLSIIGNGRRPRGSRLAVASNTAPRPQPMSTFVA
jgi:hypothetical protein